MTTAKKPKATRIDLMRPPSHLSAEATELWRRLTSDFQLDDAGGIALMRCATEAFDRMQEARRQIAEQGSVFKDRWGQLRANPAVAVERDAAGAGCRRSGRR